MSKGSLFKTYIKNIKPYRGGKTRKDINVGDKELIKLSSNENLLGTSPKALNAIKEAVNLLSEYPERTDKRLRERLSEFYKDELSAEQFFCANSGCEVLELICRAFLNENTEVILSNPSFKPYSLFSQATGAKVIDIPLIGDKYSLDVEGILNAINENTRLVFVTNPNNPTGTYIPKEDIRLLLQGLPDHVICVYDEVYYQYAEANKEYSIAKPFVKEGFNIIGVNSFSKAYGMAGMRMGYAYGSEKISQYVAKLSRPFMINVLGLEGAIAALDDVEFITETKELITNEKLFLYQELDRLGVKYWKSETNFIMIQPEMDDKVLEKEILTFGIMIRPVAKFGAKGAVRVTIGKHNHNVAFINALESILKF